MILDGNQIRGMKYISCINVRLALRLCRFRDALYPEKRLGGTYPDRFSATRENNMDIIRQLSNGQGKY